MQETSPNLRLNVAPIAVFWRPRVSQWVSKTTHKSYKMSLGDDFFRKGFICDPLTPVQSKHCFLHAFMTHFLQICCPGGPLKNIHKTCIQNNTQFDRDVPKVSKLGSQMGSKGLQKGPLKNDSRLLFWLWARKGSQEIPREHFKLILEVFWRSFGSYFGACLIDVGGMVVSTWEVFWSFIKGMSDVCWRWCQKYFCCIGELCPSSEDT